MHHVMLTIYIHNGTQPLAVASISVSQYLIIDKNKKLI